ncbi:hypothetical protein FPE53_24185 [Salmonella enterica subsp. enterica]|uniref:Uncharacterized protein n=2 Tax=Salmonella enterica TaxID=28901 RepID=A0A744QI37_SALER|nr:hypothetical protein [Salmonella enterica subsp. enterica serovar Aqua]ECH1172288.1 hypothetical protein [Salmonella enterica subsp. enterica serovar Aqua]HAF2609380.1 hypothetical protein [Salmonella enterica]
MKRYFIKYEYGFVLLLAVYWSLYFINDKFSAGMAGCQYEGVTRSDTGGHGFRGYNVILFLFL